MRSYLIGIFLLYITIHFLRYLPLILNYRQSAFKYESDVGLITFLTDKGALGEGLIFFELEKVPCYSRIVTNVYLPTEYGTTEIDLIYLAPSGIYVLESKNYNGWIFGDARSRYWTSVLYQTKNKFYNPIWQNRTHIKYLKRVLGTISVTSIVVFGEQAKLKKIEAEDHIVIKRRKLKRTLTKEIKQVIYTEQDIDHYYAILKQYSNQSNKVKRQHIENIKNNVTHF